MLPARKLAEWQVLLRKPLLTDCAERRAWRMAVDIASPRATTVARVRCIAAPAPIARTHGIVTNQGIAVLTLADRQGSNPHCGKAGSVQNRLLDAFHQWVGSERSACARPLDLSLTATVTA